MSPRGFLLRNTEDSKGANGISSSLQGPHPAKVPLIWEATPSPSVPRALLCSDPRALWRCGWGLHKAGLHHMTWMLAAMTGHQETLRDTGRGVGFRGPGSWVSGVSGAPVAPTNHTVTLFTQS